MNNNKVSNIYIYKQNNMKRIELKKLEEAVKSLLIDYNTTKEENKSLKEENENLKCEIEILDLLFRMQQEPNKIREVLNNKSF